MLFDKYKNKNDRFVYENTTLRFACLILAGLIVFLIWTIVARTDTERTVFLPPKIANQEFWVAGNEVSKTYLHEMGQFVSFNLLNITKENSTNNMENVLTLVAPEFYSIVKASLLEQTYYILDSGISRTFFVTGINADKKGLIVVNGIIKDILGDRVANSFKAEVNIGYKIMQGRFFIDEIGIKNLDKKE